MAPNGDVLKVERVPTPRDDYSGTLCAIEDLVGRLEDGVSQDVTSSPSIGIGTPGAWLPGEGVMKNCNSVWLNGRAL